MTCDDCKKRNQCAERSRMYPCTSFKLREEKKKEKEKQNAKNGFTL